MKKYFLVFVFLFYTSLSSYSQDFANFSIAGGPIFGWHVPSVSDLNSEITKIGLPEFSKSGFFVVGGGGFIDVPLVKGLRIGGVGVGFSQLQNAGLESAGFQNVVKTAKFSYKMGGLSVEYVHKISPSFDYSLGGIIGIGSTNISISQFSKDLQNWNIGGINPDTLRTNRYNSFDYTKTLYTFQPQVGIGYYMTNFLYLKLNAGYVFTVSGNWKLNDVLEVTNVPSGIKADGFNVNLGVNVGLFVK